MTSSSSIDVCGEVREEKKKSYHPNIVNFCLIPMTFPIEARKETETKKRLGIMRAAALSSPGSFFAQMTLSAAHKAIFEQHHSISLAGSDKEEAMLSDPTYYVMKSKCIREMNRKLQDPDPMKALDDTAIDIVTGLISATVWHYSLFFFMTLIGLTPCY